MSTAPTTITLTMRVPYERTESGDWHAEAETIDDETMRQRLTAAAADSPTGFARVLAEATALAEDLPPGTLDDRPPCQTSDEHGDPLCARQINQQPCDTCPAVSMGERVQLDRRREWAAALRHAADRLARRGMHRAELAVEDLAAGIEAGMLTPWAGDTPARQMPDQRKHGSEPPGGATASNEPDLDRLRAELRRRESDGSALPDDEPVRTTIHRLAYEAVEHQAEQRATTTDVVLRELIYAGFHLLAATNAGYRLPEPPPAAPWAGAPTERQPVDIPASLAEFGQSLTPQQRAEWLAALRAEDTPPTGLSATESADRRSGSADPQELERLRKAERERDLAERQRSRLGAERDEARAEAERLREAVHKCERCMGLLVWSGGRWGHLGGDEPCCPDPTPAEFEVQATAAGPEPGAGGSGQPEPETAGGEQA